MAGREGKDEKKIDGRWSHEFHETSRDCNWVVTRQFWGKHLGSFVGHVSSKVWFFFIYLYVIDYIIMYKIIEYKIYNRCKYQGINNIF